MYFIGKCFWICLLGCTTPRGLTQHLYAENQESREHSPAASHEGKVTTASAYAIQAPTPDDWDMLLNYQHSIHALQLDSKLQQQILAALHTLRKLYQVSHTFPDALLATNEPKGQLKLLLNQSPQLIAAQKAAIILQRLWLAPIKSFQDQSAFLIRYRDSFVPNPAHEESQPALLQQLQAAGVFPIAAMLQEAQSIPLPVKKYKVGTKWVTKVEPSYIRHKPSEARWMEDTLALNPFITPIFLNKLKDMLAKLVEALANAVQLSNPTFKANRVLWQVAMRHGWPVEIKELIVSTPPPPVSATPHEGIILAQQHQPAIEAWLTQARKQGHAVAPHIASLLSWCTTIATTQSDTSDREKVS